MSYYENALKLRPFVEKAATHLSDEDALQAVSLFPEWKTNTAYGVDSRVQHVNILYKCIQAHTSIDTWSPDVTQSLWVVISLEEGGKDKPITAVRGMEYQQDKYYLDIEDGNTYICTRSAVLHYLPHELVGHYFTIT